MNWIQNYRLHRIRQDYGENALKTHHKSKTKTSLLKLWFHPYMEWTSIFIIVLSVGLLFWEMSLEHNHSVSWMSAHRANLSILNWIDLGVTIFFIVELAFKLMLAPKKWFFIKNSVVDILAVLPIFRVFRLARTARLLRIVRLFRTVRAGKILRSDLVKEKTHVFFRTENTAMLTYLFMSVIFGTVGIMVFEKGANESFVTLGDGLWWCIVTITTVGYGDMFPITVGGKLVAVSIMFVGLSFYAMLTGAISTVLIERAQQIGDRAMDLTILEEHIVICGWNDDIFDVLETLMCTTNRNILIIAENPKQEIASPRVMILNGNPSNKTVLETGQISQAFSAIILSERQDGHSSKDSDANSILVALAIKISNPSLHITIELQDPNNIEHASNAGATDFITATAYQGALLAQSASSPGVAKIFARIFIDPQTYMEKVDVPSELIGQNYLSLVNHCVQTRLGAVLGLSQFDQILLSPPPDTIIQASHQVLMLSTDDTFDTQSF